MAWLGVVTNAGKELLGGWLAGQTLQISGAAGGSGTVREAALLAQTELVEQQQVGSIVSYKTVEGGQKIKLQFPAAEAAYTLNQIGIWGNVGGENKLLALFQNAEGVAISSKAEFPDFAYTFYAVLAIGNEGALAVTVDAEAWVTIKTLQEALEGYVKVDESGKIPDEVLPVDEALSSTSGNPVQNKVINAALAGKVPTTRKVNNKALSADISLTAADVGARPSTWTPTAAEVGAVPTSRKVNNKALSADISLTAADVGALPANGKAVTAGTADTAKACSGNSATATTAVSCSGNAATATKLATARNISVNVGSNTGSNFDGSTNITPGVFGILSVANGGTGANSAAAARDNLGIKNAPIAFGYLGQVTSSTTVLGFTPKIVFIMGCNYSDVPAVNGERIFAFMGKAGLAYSGYYDFDITFNDNGFSIEQGRSSLYVYYLALGTPF